MSLKLLFIEDSKLVLKVMRMLVKEHDYFEADFAETYAQAEELIGDSPEKYFAAMVDLNLPDAPNGEVVDLVLKHNIPAVVLTASYSDKKRDEFFKKGIIDYVVKESRYSYSYAMKLMIRLTLNHKIKVLVVDDSLVARKHIASLLEKYRFDVVSADGAKSAIKELINSPDIKLIITDYNMPEVDGFELVKLLRGKYDKQELTIIGISGEGNASLSAQFIKNGANDFLRKPFNQEEFYCRVMHNVESLEAIEQIKDAANRDNLTQLYNREHFYELAQQKISWCQKNKLSYMMAIIKIDDFVAFNNVYKEYGDKVFRFVAKKLKKEFSEFITARLNGTQLVVFAWDLSLSDCESYMNEFRENIKESPVIFGDEELYLSVSIGFSYSDDKDLIQMLEHSGDLIERSEYAGNNIVLYES